MRILSIVLVMAVIGAACSSGSVFDEQSGAGPSTVTTSRPSDEADPLPEDQRDLADSPANPATIDYELALASAATVTIDETGGTLTTSSGGIEMTLVIPPGALIEATDITLTPVTAASSPLIDLSMGGAEFSPAGLILGKPATLRLAGVDPPRNPLGVTWDQSGGEVSPMAFRVIEGGVEMPIIHFSGAGAGTRRDGSSDYRNSTQADRIKSVAIEARIGQAKCVSAKQPAGRMILALFEFAAERDVLPALKAAQSNDMVLMAAITTLLEWWSIPELLVATGFICPDLNESLTSTIIDFRDEVQLRLSVGLTHAIFESARVCESTKDDGEFRHMLGWVATAQLMELVVDALSPTIGPSWESLAADAIQACTRYRVELFTKVSLGPAAGSLMGAVIRTKAEDVPNDALHALVGSMAEPGFVFEKAEYQPWFDPREPDCTVSVTLDLAPIGDASLFIVPLSPRRVIPGRNDDASESDDQAGRLTLGFLEESGSVKMTCEDAPEPFYMPVQGKVLDWFNFGHPNPNPASGGPVAFELGRESAGDVVASYTHEGTLIANPEGDILEKTEIIVIQTPRKMPYDEPPPPP